MQRKTGTHKSLNMSGQIRYIATSCEGFRAACWKETTSMSPPCRSNTVFRCCFFCCCCSCYRASHRRRLDHYPSQLGEGLEGCVLDRRDVFDRMRGRSRMIIDPHIRTMPGRSPPCFHRPGRHCSLQTQSAVKCSASRVKGELHSPQIHL